MCTSIVCHFIYFNGILLKWFWDGQNDQWPIHTKFKKRYKLQSTISWFCPDFANSTSLQSNHSFANSSLQSVQNLLNLQVNGAQVKQKVRAFPGWTCTVTYNVKVYEDMCANCTQFWTSIMMCLKLFFVCDNNMLSIALTQSNW